MIFCWEQICIGSSATALIAYLLSKIKCVCKSPCDCTNALCIYGSNEASFNHMSDEDNEIIVMSAKRTKHNCI